MPKIYYVVHSMGGLTGGQKMAVRHVEALRDLGFDAYCYLANQAPGGLMHRAPLVKGQIAPDTIVVLPDDSEDIFRQCAGKRWRMVIFAQNPYYMAAKGLKGIDALIGSTQLAFLTVGQRMAATIRRLYPSLGVEVVRCFADERAFRPAAAKSRSIAFTPRKRKTEADAIAALFRRMHPQHGAFEWTRVENASEEETAEAFARSSVFLSLSRLESVGMTTLEAMATGSVCAGFTGIGGLEYATPENGFWVPEDDCEAAADALAEACAVVSSGGPELARRLEAGYETARQWSYAAFLRQLEETWMRLAPDARLKSRPLDR
jgi:hypothetical protein